MPTAPEIYLPILTYWGTITCKPTEQHVQHFFFRKCHWTYLFQLEITCENSSLAAVHTVAAIEEFRHEGRIKGIEVNRGHVVNGEGDFLLKKVVTFVEKDLQQHIDEVEEHWGPEKLLKDPQTHTKKKTKMKMRVTLVCVIEFTHVDEGNVCCLSCTVQELWCWDPFTAALITDNQNKYIKLI